MTKKGIYMNKEIKILSNGAKIVSIKIDGIKTLLTSCMVKAGSRVETEKTSGAAHFLEHMAFKGTHTKSYMDIAKAIENYGGYMNANTSTERTFYYTKTLSKHYKTSIDIITDIVFNSSFITEEFEKERGVILQEILMYQDQPHAVLEDIAEKVKFPNHNLGRPILGSYQGITDMSKNTLIDFYKQFYQPNMMTFIVIGDLNHNEIQDEIESKIGHIKNTNENIIKYDCSYVGGNAIEYKDIEQAHVLISYPLESIYDDSKYAVQLFNSILGNGVTSRLWEEIREKRGLAYSVSSNATRTFEVGSFDIYCGTDLPKVAIDVIIELLENFENTITEEDILTSKEKIITNICMSLETPSGILNTELMKELYGFETSVEEVIERFQNVQLEEVKNAFNNMIKNDKSIIQLLPKKMLSI